jgi:DNA-binding transcriptional ArsR family regulator
VDQLPEVYNLESIEQMRALADELRLRIVELLTQQPMTVTQLGEVLGVAPAKVHYHVRELERVGLLRLSFTREKSGILEKYYTAVAKNLSIPSSLLQQTPPDELLAAFNGYLQTAVAGFMRAASTLLRTKPEALTDKSTTMSIGGSTLWLTPDEFREFSKQLEALVQRYAQRRGIEGEREVVVFEMAYDARLSGESQEQAIAPSAHAGQPPSPPSPSRSPQPPMIPVPPPPSGLPSVTQTRKGGRVMAAGAVTFSKRDLEQVVARGDQLDINVLGYCGFDSDIPPELADRAVARFRYRGVISASPEVREILKRKES